MQYTIKNINEEKEHIEQNLSGQLKKIQKKEDYFKEQISQVTKKSFDLQK